MMAPDLETQRPPQLTDAYLHEKVREALEEDSAISDLTTEALVEPGLWAEAQIVAKTAGVIAGLIAAEEVYSQLDGSIEFVVLAADGSAVEAGDVVAGLSGPMGSLLSGERTALNFLQQMSGVASLTRRYAQLAASHGGAVILDTRKTAPGLRPLQRYAVLAGGGANHRYNLSLAVLIKDNHVEAAGSIGEAVRRARASGIAVELEVDDLGQLKEALTAGVETILLDNFSPSQVAQAVRLVAGRALLEVSGGVQLSNLAAYAATGVDRISVGALTHSAAALDISLDVLRTWKP